MREYFEGISDPRQQWKTAHNLHEIVIMTICAVISGCEHWEDIADFCRVKMGWFRERLGLELTNGVAAHDAFQRVFQLIDPKELERCFVAWVRGLGKTVKGDMISIDGKTVCGSQDNDGGAIRMVSAWANSAQLVLGQIKVNEKSNEITAIPLL